MDKQIILTDDGSHTLFIPDLNEHYHSTFGAIQESEHIFIRSGLHYCMQFSRNLNILEVGMGTGLNVLLSVAESKQHALSIQYTALEPYPLPLSLASELNYAKSGKLKAYQKLFNDIHTDDWCTPVMLHPGFVFKKLKSTIQEMVLQNNCFQLVYFDAFSPAVQPEMWTSAVFVKIFTAMVSAGILVTYCAKGSVKKLLKEVGFRVESLQGPPGKREITRAIKP